MGHLCGSTCKRKTGGVCAAPCRRPGKSLVALLDANGILVKPPGPHAHATPHEKGAAVDMYYDGLSYCRTAENVGQCSGREINATTVYRWVRGLAAKADEILRPMKVTTGDTWVADELTVNVGGKKFWLCNVMDSKTRFVLAAYLSPVRTTRAAATAPSLAREQAENHPEEIKTDGLRSYADAMPRAFPIRKVKHTISKGIRAEINNNLSERLQGAFQDRDKALRGAESAGNRPSLRLWADYSL